MEKDEDSVDEIEVENPKVLRTVSNGVGESKYDHHYKTFTCCYCQKPIALSMDTIKIMTDERIMDWHRHHKYLPRDEEERIKDDVNKRELGYKYSRTQYIHSRCYDLLQLPENTAIVAIIKEKQDFKIPTIENATIYSFFRYPNTKTRLCEYGDGQLDEWNPGFRYIFLDDPTTSHYLHHRCLAHLTRSKARAKERITSLSDDFRSPPENPTSSDLWNLELLRHRADEWIDFLGRFIITTQNILHFHEFLSGVSSIATKIVNNEERELWTNELARIISLTDEEEKFMGDSTSISEKKVELTRLRNVLNDYPRQPLEDEIMIYRYYNLIQYAIFFEGLKKDKKKV